MPPSSPSVLVIRLDAIGDALALTPLLAALRERRIPVDLVMRAVNAGIFSSRAARSVYVAPFALRSSTASNRRAIAQFGARLAANGYTHVLDATEDPGGYRLAKATGARQRIGFVNGWGKPLKTLWARSMLTSTLVRSAGLDPRAPHECEVLYRLGATLVGDRAIPRDATELRPLVLENDVAPANHVVFQVSDKWERLGIAFAQVARALNAVAEIGNVRALAAAAEAAYARRMSDATGIAVESFSDVTPWKAAIAGAAALVTPDSGALHVAGMLGTPTVAVFPPVRDFDLQLARWSPWAAPFRAVRADGDWPARVVSGLQELHVPVRR